MHKLPALLCYFYKRLLLTYPFPINLFKERPSLKMWCQVTRAILVLSTVSYLWSCFLNIICGETKTYDNVKGQFQDSVMDAIPAISLESLFFQVCYTWSDIVIQQDDTLMQTFLSFLTNNFHPSCNQFLCWLVNLELGAHVGMMDSSKFCNQPLFLG